MTVHIQAKVFPPKAFQAKPTTSKLNGWSRNKMGTFYNKTNSKSLQ